MKLKEFNDIVFKIDIVVTLICFTILIFRFNQVTTTGDFLIIEIFAFAAYDLYQKIKETIKP